MNRGTGLYEFLGKIHTKDYVNIRIYLSKNT